MPFQPPFWPLLESEISRCPPWSDVKYISVLLARPRESTVSVILPRKRINTALEMVEQRVQTSLTERDSKIALTSLMIKGQLGLIFTSQVISSG